MWISARGIINISGSLPLGFYKKITSAQIERGAIVVVCPDLENPAIQLGKERGYLSAGWGCKGRLRPLMKRVLALPGDLVEISEGSVRVNGRKIKYSSRLEVDGARRPLPLLPASGEVPNGYVWLFSGYSPSSFDSRYFGPIKQSAIKSIVTPRYVWHDPRHDPH